MADKTHDRTVWTVTAVNAAVVILSMAWVWFSDSATSSEALISEAASPAAPPALQLNFGSARTSGNGPIRG
jgi:hypothetical protein